MHIVLNWITQYVVVYNVPLKLIHMQAVKKDMPDSLTLITVVPRVEQNGKCN